MTKDYEITMRDDTGRECTICVNGASIDEWMAAGYTANEAHEAAHNQAFENAVRDGEIGAQAVLIHDEYDALIAQQEQEAHNMNNAAAIMIDTLTQAADEVQAMAQGPAADRWVMRFSSGLYVCSAKGNSGLTRAIQWASSTDAMTQAGDMRDGTGEHPTPYTVRQAAELDIQSLQTSIDAIRAATA